MLREVIDVREIRKRSPHAELFPRAEMWNDYTLNDCAKAVHNEVSIIYISIMPQTTTIFLFFVFC